ncbi:MAG: flagellar filament capping protein FliD [Panacagrimonas sp.]
MAISSAGIGSGLDVQSLVSQLVAAERAPAENRLNLRETTARTTLSALGTYKSVLSGFQTAVNALKGINSSLGKLATSSSEPTLFSASSSGSAVAGSFNVEVIQLARAGKIATDVYASASTVVGNGTVTLSVAGESFDITLADGDNTLAALRDKINQASDNTGVSAVILNQNGGARLVLTSRETGVANTVSLSSAAAIGGASFVNTSSVQTALDAEVEIDGFAYSSASNTLDKTIDGVTINLLKAVPGTVGTLGLSLDSSASSAAVENLVKSYNALVATVSTFTRYDASTRIAGPLSGDASVRTTQQQVRGILGSVVGSGDYSVLSQLGVSTQNDGTLKLDSSELTSALQADPRGVKNLFGASDGYSTRLSALLEGVLGSSGAIKSGTEGLQARLDDISDRRDALDLRIAAVERRYRAQFTALDTLLGQRQTTSSYLTQQLANLPGYGSG